MENKPTTVNVVFPNQGGRQMLLKDGDIVKIKRQKRLCLKFICGIVDGLNETYTMKAVWNPSPKSTLNKKSPFSKFKMELYKSKNRTR